MGGLPATAAAVARTLAALAGFGGSGILELPLHAALPWGRGWLHAGFGSWVGILLGCTNAATYMGSLISGWLLYDQKQHSCMSHAS